MPKFDEFWKKATDIHAELGVSCMVQPSLPCIENEDDAKVVSEIFNRAGEITKKAESYGVTIIIAMSSNGY